MKYIVFWLAVILISPVTRAAEQELWFYQATNLLPDQNVAQLDPLWRRAAAAGYSHVLLTDSKFSRLNEMGKGYFANIDKVKQLAAELHLQIVPAVFPIGWSNDLLGHNPNLAEGEPVKDALFVVHHGEAKLVADPEVALPANPDWKDESVAVAGNVATVRNNPANARFVFTVKVSPFRCYHASVWIKTDRYTGEPEIKALAGEPLAPLHYNVLGVKRSQDWTQHHVVFNSLDNKQVKLYFGVWGKAAGTLQWRDWQMEEAGLVNVLRRPGTPLVVKGYVEGKDFEPVSDPHLGNKPWPGEYEVWHEPPTIKTKLPDGTKLRVSWFHPAIINGGSVCVCVSEKETMDLLADQAKRVTALFQPKGVMMSHDEIRIMNWDDACQDRHQTPGEILAANTKACIDLLAGHQVYAWSDMFDPHHNAHDHYYLVNGDLTGSWQGLSPKVTIMNWNFGHRDESLKFFADRGHEQIIAGYYDGNVGQIKQWMASAKKVQGVVGYMYTTWEHKYDDLEAFAKLVKE